MMEREKKKYFKGLNRKDYIERAYEIIEKEGIEAISIRRMAKEFACSSTCMYRYFANIEELIYYANLIYLDEYLRDLSAHEKDWDNAWDMHIGIWECYGRTGFRHPKAFDIIFFSRTAQRMAHAIQEFYEIFPERINIVSPYLQVFFQSSNLLVRDMVNVERCMEAGVIDQGGAEVLNHMVCILWMGYLKDALDYGISEAEIETRTQQWVSEVTKICQICANEKGREMLSKSVYQKYLQR